MIQYKSGVKEIVIARYTYRPTSEQMTRAWKESKRCEEIDKRFPLDLLRVDVVEKGYELVARMK